MSCLSVMLRDPVTVRGDTQVVAAIDLLFQQRVRTLPVVDAQGVYLGLFGIQFLLKELLPRAVTLDADMDLGDLAFVHDTLEDMRANLKERLQILYPRPVDAVAHRAMPPLEPGDSLMEAMLRIHRAGYSLPVVDDQTHKLLGVVTHWSILAGLTGHTL